MRFRSFWLWLTTIGLLAAGRPVHAIPKFAREYGVRCNTCHAIPPRLNAFGKAFQANNFNWPGGKPPAPNTGLKAFPMTVIAKLSYEDNRSEHESSARFRELELFFADRLGAAKRPAGGFFSSLNAATSDEDERAGSLEQAFVMLPVAGRRGQWTLGAGQFSAMMYQWDPVNNLLESSPGALADDFDAFSFAAPQPGLRVDYFDHRGEGTADGNYVALGVPFEGRLALNSHARLHGPRGLFAHAFRRRGLDSLGAFAYTHAGHTLGGLVGTYQFSPKVYLLGAGAVGDDAGSTRRLSLEGEYVAGHKLALTARLDLLGGQRNDVGGAAGVTYYPLQVPFFRLTLETTQRKGDRMIALFARGQY